MFMTIEPFPKTKQNILLLNSDTDKRSINVYVIPLHLTKIIIELWRPLTLY